MSGEQSKRRGRIKKIVDIDKGWFGIDDVIGITARLVERVLDTHPTI